MISQMFQMVQLPGNLNGGSTRLAQPCSYGFELSLLFTESDPLAEVVAYRIELVIDIPNALEEIVQVYS